MRGKVTGIAISLALLVLLAAFAGTRHERTVDLVWVGLALSLVAVMSGIKLYLVYRHRHDPQRRELEMMATGGIYPRRLREFLFGREEKTARKIDPML